MTETTEQLARIGNKIASFGKENLDEMLHMVGEGVRLVSSLERVRIYLEDLTRGALFLAPRLAGRSGEAHGSPTIRQRTFRLATSGLWIFRRPKPS